MNGTDIADEMPREPILNPVDRISEMLFGLFMALTFVGAVSVAGRGQEEVRTLFITAFGCNIAWGLVDAVMYLVRTATARGRQLRLVLAVRAAPDEESGRLLVRRALLAAIGIFLIVVAATFPVVLPFAFFSDVAVAKWVSRGLALAMLFAGGLALGRYAGYGSWKAGLLMAGLGTALTVAIIALGG